MRLIIAFPPGGPVDLVGRVLAEQLGKELKQQVIVENKAGANGNIAASYVAKAPGDGSVVPDQRRRRVHQPGAVQGPAL